MKNKGSKGWLLYDSGYAADSSQQADGPADAAADAAAAEQRTPGLAQWLVKLVPGLSPGLLQQLGCECLEQLLLLPGLFDTLLMVAPAEGGSNNM